MIVSGDKRASSAFLEGLLMEPPPSSVTPLNNRSILQVSGLDHAIAVADDEIRARTKSEPPPADLFDTLSARTDDVAAPAIYRPYVPTPIPPPLADQTMVMAIPPPAALPSFPAPIVVLDRDLFFHPPMPVHLPSMPERKRSLGWAIGAALVPIVTLIAIALTLSGTQAWSERPHASQATMIPQPVTTLPPVPAASTQLAHPAEKIMVVEVKQLKSAPPPTPPAKRRH